MMKNSFLLIFTISYASLFAQDLPNIGNVSNEATAPSASGKFTATPVNLFTGTPNVAVPIYSYTSPNGVGMNVALQYIGGGIQMAQAPSCVGLGWALSTGGQISRAVRGLPDDVAQYGYMFSSAIPTDFRSQGNKYYYDSLDAQQDIFYYNFEGHNGKFFFGKNGQIVTVPASKLKIIPAFATQTGIASTLVSFRIIAENGIKYDFLQTDYSSPSVATQSLPSGYAGSLSGFGGQKYSSAWHLSQVISAFGSDTIRFSYTGVNRYDPYSYPQVTFVRNSDGVRTVTYMPTGNGYFGSSQIDSISLPNKVTLKFVYDQTLGASTTERALSKIKIYDTAFRQGYAFDYITTNFNPGLPAPAKDYSTTRIALKKITPYTPKEKSHPYQFDYWELLQAIGTYDDTVQNKVDYWGFYNGAVNGTVQIPKINNYTWGADRNPTEAAYIGSLKRYYIPEGGFVEYNYELNEHAPYTRTISALSLDVSVNTQNTFTVAQVYSNRQHVIFQYSDAQARAGTSPVSGSGNLICTIKNTGGTVTYATYTFSLNDLFYTGLKTWDFVLPNGTYQLQTALSSGTSVSGSFPITIDWENKAASANAASQTGGLRVRAITRHLPNSMVASAELYHYTLADGTSSGFFGDIPRYDYPYREVVAYNGTTTTDYTAISSQPVSTLDYAQGGLVGYSRVEVLNGFGSNYYGSQVYEFTDLIDANSNSFATAFPYTPQETKSWALGLPKRITIYDSLGNVVKRTTNTFQVDTVVYANDNFKSIRLGQTQTKYNGNPALSSTPKIRTYIGEEYYLQGGRAYLVNILDSLFHPDGSLNVTARSISYDTNYNVVKVVAGYDRSRGLSKETRLYYPYNYTVTSGGVAKLRDSGLISQVVSSESWITGDANPRMIAGAVSSFKQISSGEVKPDIVYSIETNKPLAQSTIGSFNPAMLNRNITYFKAQSQFASYDAKGNPVEIQNSMTGQSNSLLMDYGNIYPVAKVSNAVLADIAYTSFESDGSGNWNIGSATRDNTQSFTGRKSYNLSNGALTKSGLSSSQTYLVTLWVKTGASFTINAGSSGTPLATQNGWSLYSTVITSSTSVTISGSGTIDDVRLHPKGANMMTNTYEPMVGITSTVDANNTVVYNEYDNLLRPKLLRDKDKNIIKRFDYSDSTMTVSLAPQWVFTQRACLTDQSGGYDSVFVDVNPFSDSFNSVKREHGTDYCSCSTPALHPEYKLINGACELGIRMVTSHTRIRNYNVWQWRCVYNYQWSDSSTSESYTTYSDSESDCIVVMPLD